MARKEFPEDFLKRIKNQFPDFQQDLVSSLNHTPPVSIRINKKKQSKKVAEYDTNSLESVPWSENGYYLPERPAFIFDPLIHVGAYYVQEASSMVLEKIIPQVLDINSSLTVLDLCASPGGKSTLISGLLNEKSLLVSNEVIKNRVGTLKENIVKWGNDNTIITNNDSEDFLSLEDFFDLIVVDAPCSGEGMFRKDENAREEWSNENVLLCSHRQKRILQNIIRSLKPGGVLIYSTCTFSEEENREIANWVLNEFKLSSLQIKGLSGIGIVEKSDKNLFSYHFYPNFIKGEGFFTSIFKKENAEIEPKVSRFKLPSLATSKELLLIKTLFNNMDKYDVYKLNEDFVVFKRDFKEQFSKCFDKLKIVRFGTNIGSFIHNQFIPSHELAMNQSMTASFAFIELDKKQALVYLKKEDVSNFSQISNLSSGWYLVRHNGLNLGWIKKINNRANNYLPKELRILKDLE